MASIPKYLQFIRENLSWSHSTNPISYKYRKDMIDDAYDRIIPGIRDILSSYQDDQKDPIIVTLIDSNYQPVSIDSAELTYFLYGMSGHQSIRIRVESKGPFSNTTEILDRILSEFGDDISVDERTQKNISNGRIRFTTLDFYLSKWSP